MGIAYDLDPNDPADGNRDRNGDGYTNLEEYLDWLHNPRGRFLDKHPSSYMADVPNPSQLKDGQMYTCRVRGIIDSGKGPWSDPSFFITKQSTSSATDGDIPIEFQLSQNYPNPFNPVTVIQYSLPDAAHVNLHLYDINGQEMAVLVNGKRPAGSHSVMFDSTTLSSGVYFYRIRVTYSGNSKRDAFVQTRSMTILK